jgi:hypothetical protein
MFSNDYFGGGGASNFPLPCVTPNMEGSKSIPKLQRSSRIPKREKVNAVLLSVCLCIPVTHET